MSVLQEVSFHSNTKTRKTAVHEMHMYVHTHTCYIHVSYTNVHELHNSVGSLLPSSNVV